MNYCKQLIAKLEYMRDEEGLLGLSGTNFRKHPVRRVLAAKQYEHRMYTSKDLFNPRSGRFASKALIAKDLLAMFKAAETCEDSTTYYPDGTVTVKGKGCIVE